MQLKRIQNKLSFQITHDSFVAFKDEWIEQLRALPYDQYGDFLKDTIYPALKEEEQRLWRKAQISNKALHAALQEPV